jgi:O-antigen/teichoic acid export membrane protein
VSIARHTLYNFAGAALPLATALVTVPLYLRAVGTERYGVLAICWLVLSYFGLFDFGLGRATAQKIAALCEGDPDERSAVFWTSVFMTLGLSIAAVVLFVPAAGVALGTTKTSSGALHEEAMAAIPWLSVSVPLALLSGVTFGALEGRQRFLAMNLIGGAGTLVSSLLPLFIAWYVSPELQYLVAAAVLSRALSVLLTAVAGARAVPIRRPVRPSRAMVRSLAVYGGWIAVSSIIGPILSLWDRFAVGAVLGAAAVAFYVVPFNLVSQLTLFAGALSVSLFPRLSAATHEESLRLSQESVRALACAMTPVVVGTAIVLHPFLNLWLGRSFAAAAGPAGSILLAGVWTNCLARVPLSRLQAQGRPDLTAKTHLAELIPYGIVLYLAMKAFGIPGVALAWTIRCAADWAILTLLSDRSPLAMSEAAIPAALVAAAAALTALLPVDSPLLWAFVVPVGLLSLAWSVRNIPAPLLALAGRSRIVPRPLFRALAAASRQGAGL